MKRMLEGLALLSALTCMMTVPASAAEPRCNVMQFFDAKGALMATSLPVIGIMVGDRAVYDPPMPGAASVRAGAEASCPPSLIGGVRSTFETKCMSDQRRKQAAVDHKVDSKVIDKGCADMMTALGSAMAAPK